MRADIIKTYLYLYGQSLTIDKADTLNDWYFEIQLLQCKYRSVIRWTQLSYFSNYLADIGGLFTSLMAGARFILSGY